MKKNKLYEQFHSLTSSQKYIIDRNNFTYRIIVDVLDQYLDSAKKSVLDIGCGAGTTSFYMASKGKKVYGIDIAHNSIAACKESAKQLHLEERTAFSVMDFPDESPKEKKFDAVVCFEVIEHLQDDEKALKKIYALLDKGGIAIISTPSKNAPLYKTGYAEAFDKRVGHLRRYTVEELKDKCIKAGFEIVATKKTEGVIRNFLYLNPIAGKLIKFIRYFIIDIALFVDWISMKLFGESDLFIIIRKK